MGKTYVLYNPIAGNGKCDKQVKELEKLFLEEELIFIDSHTLNGCLEEFFNNLIVDDRVILCGGDGTLNNFVNQIDTDTIENDVFYYPLGSGNDFYNDIVGGKEKKVVLINDYIKNLPYVEVNGLKRRFINAIGFGIDGYCCEEGDRVRLKKPGKPVNYTPIALKGLAYAYSRVNAKITIDGEEFDYSDVWMAPALNGRFYGGGMMCAPHQDRINNNNKVDVIVVTTKSRLKLLLAFSSIFKGEHVKYKSIVKEYKGCNVTVEFDKPTSLQIDGDTITDVVKYTVYRK